MIGKMDLVFLYYFVVIVYSCWEVIDKRRRLRRDKK